MSFEKITMTDIKDGLSQAFSSMLEGLSPVPNREMIDKALISLGMPYIYNEESKSLVIKVDEKASIICDYKSNYGFIISFKMDYGTVSADFTPEDNKLVFLSSQLEGALPLLKDVAKKLKELHSKFDSQMENVRSRELLIKLVKERLKSLKTSGIKIKLDKHDESAVEISRSAKPGICLKTRLTYDNWLERVDTFAGIFNLIPKNIWDKPTEKIDIKPEVKILKLTTGPIGEGYRIVKINPENISSKRYASDFMPSPLLAQSHPLLDDNREVVETLKNLGFYLGVATVYNREWVNKKVVIAEPYERLCIQLNNNVFIAFDLNEKEPRWFYSGYDGEKIISSMGGFFNNVVEFYRGTLHESIVFFEYIAKYVDLTKFPKVDGQYYSRANQYHLQLKEALKDSVVIEAGVRCYYKYEKCGCYECGIGDSVSLGLYLPNSKDARYNFIRVRCRFGTVIGDYNEMRPYLKLWKRMSPLYEELLKAVQNLPESLDILPTIEYVADW